MRKATFAALAGATALVVGIDFACADTSLFNTVADFGGSKALSPNPYTGYPSEPVETHWEGMGYYVSGTSAVAPSDTLGLPITYQTTTLANPTSTIVGTNGLADIDDYNPPTNSSGRVPDANLGTGWAGDHAPLGSMTVQGYQGASETLPSGSGGGGYDVISTGEMIVPQGTASSVTSTASTAFINALATGNAMAIDFTAPGGGTTLTADGNNPSPYYIMDFGTYDSNGGLHSGGGSWVNPSFSVSNKDPGNYGDDPGSFVVTHGTGPTSYWTGYLPYSYAAAATTTYLQFILILNMDGFVGGNVTIDNIRTVSPTWAGAGDGLSWTTNTSPTSTDWIGGLPGGVVGGASGASATMADIETGNATTTLDATWTLGLLTFNTLQYTYNIAPGTSGSLVMDNTANTADAAINDVAGGSATSGGGTAPNYTEYITAPVKLVSNTDVTVTRSTDVLDISGNITGAAALSMSGAGTLELTGANSYSGGTTVNAGATLIASYDGALPNNKALVNNGKTLLAGNEILSSLSGSGTLTVGNGTENNTVQLAANSGLATLGGLVIAAGSTLDLVNNHMMITYGTSDPITTIAGYIKSGYNGGHWNGPGIISSVALTNASGLLYGVGYADGKDNVVVGLTSGQIELKYTLLGDANLDGLVNGSDFNILAANFNQSITGWDQGDFNYDGLVNASDFNVLAANFNQGVSGTASAGDVAALDAFAAANGLSLPTSSVPEPASMGLLTLGVVGVLARRRRQ
jgi:autotransporter-associated beta strand protein